MTNADIVAVSVAGAALLIALVGVPVYGWRQRKRTHVPIAGDAVTDQPPIHADHPVSIRLVGDPALPTGRWWLLESTSTAATTIQILSYRVEDDHHGNEWQHELMDAPVVVPPGRSVHVPAPDDPAGTRYDVSLGWSVAGTDGPSEGSRYLTIQASR